MATTMLDLRIRAVDAATLTPLVQQALNRSTITLMQWNIEPLRVVKGGIGIHALYRFTGSAEDHGATISWSIILKVLTEPVGNERREVEFYRSGIARAFPPGLRPAHCYTITEQINETGQTEYWLWLEEVVHQSGIGWTLDDHYQAARCLGQFQGAFVVDYPLPSAPWFGFNGTSWVSGAGCSVGYTTPATSTPSLGTPYVLTCCG